MTEREPAEDVCEAIDQALEDNDQWHSLKSETLVDEMGSPKTTEPQ